MKLNEMTASAVVLAVAQGKATIEQVVRACLERIEQREPQVGAWTYHDPDQALRRARRLDASGARGPLAGATFGIKDIIDTCDMPTGYGSPIYTGTRPKNDAACVALGRSAGGVLLGKTVTTEFANVFPGKTCNPHDVRRTPGGSSSGSAAAVGDCQAHLAIGTQTTASTIRPASFCGIYGYRPTFATISCSGVRQSSGSLDTIGLYGRSIDDIALYRDVVMGISPQPLPQKISAPPRIAFCRTPFWNQLEPGIAELIEEAALKLARAGAKVKDLTLPREFEQIEDAHRWISSFEFVRNFNHEISNHWDQLSDMLRNGRVAHGQSCSFERHANAQRFAHDLRQKLAQLFEPFDILITPAAAGEAPIGLNSTGNPVYCTIWTSMYVPALSVPAFKGPNGLPVGLQLIGRWHEDRTLFEHARWVMRQLG